jgi:hypothetical protein
MDIDDPEEVVRQLRPWKQRVSRVAFVISRARVGAAFAVVTIGTASLIWAAAPQVVWGHAHVMPGGFPVTMCDGPEESALLLLGTVMIAIPVAAAAWISREWRRWVRCASIFAHVLVVASPLWLTGAELRACKDQERRDWENLERNPPFVELKAAIERAELEAVEAERRAQEEAIRRAPGPLCDCQPNDPLCSCE